MKLTLQQAASAVADLFEAAPETWTHGTNARSEFGFMVAVDDPIACCFCAIGGLRAASGCSQAGAYNFLARVQPFPTRHNDQRGRLAAIRMLRRAAGEIECERG